MIDTRAAPGERTGPVPADVAGNFRWLGAASLPLIVALSIQNASNLGFHLVVSRILGPSRYGELAALLAIVLVFAVPTAVTQTIAAKNVARVRLERGSRAAHDLLAGMAKTVVYAGVVILPLSLLLVPVVGDFLRVPWTAAVLIGPYLVVTLLAGLALGGLQGSTRFGALGFAIAAGVLVRFVIGLALTSTGLGVAGAMIATVVAAAVAGVLAFAMLSIDPASWATARANVDAFRTDFRPAVLALGSFALLTQLDLILARHFLDAHDAGVYSGTILVARGLLFVPAALAMVVFPRFVELRASGALARRWLHVSMAATLLVAAIALPAMHVFGPTVISLVLGGQFQPSTVLITWLGGGVVAVALANLLVQFHIAAETHAYRIVLLGSVAEAVLVQRFHGSPQQLAVVGVLVAAAVTAALYHAARAASFRPAQAAPSRIAHDGAEVDVTVVLPCHNSGAALASLLDELRTETLRHRSFEIVVVSEGCTDDTVAIARAAGSNVRVIERSARGGKGNALHLGLSAARGRHIAFMDSDGDIHPADLGSLLSLTETYDPDVVVGSKRHPLSRVDYPLSRRVMSWTYHKLTRALFRVNVRDTQTGLKLIRRDVLAAALPRMLEKRFAFDLELLVVTRLLGHKRVFEAPVRIDYQFQSHIDLRQTLRIVSDTLAIFYRRYVLATYHRPSLPGTPRVHAMRRPAGVRTSRILFLNWRDIRNPAAGGAEVFTHEVAKRWAARGHHVELLTSSFPGCARVERVDGVVVRRLGALTTGALHLRVQQQLASLDDVDLVIDEINGVGFLTPLWRRRLPPIVALVHQLAIDVWHAELPPVLADVAQWIEPRLLRLYADIPTVTVSESTRRDLMRVGVRNVQVIPEGLDTPPPVPHEPDGPPSVLFVGRLARNKRPGDAIEAFRTIKGSIPDARLDVVGRGVLEEELRDALPEDAVMHGFVPREELYRLMARARCLLVPSVREGFGLVVAEANSVGTPAVGYDVPGLRDSIEHGRTGVLVPDGDVQAMARAAVSIVMNPAKRDRFSVAARAAVRELSWDATADRWMDVLARWELLPGPHTPRADARVGARHAATRPRRPAAVAALTAAGVAPTLAEA